MMAEYKQKNNEKRIMKIKSHTGRGVKGLSITFTFMHLADAFIQRNLYCISKYTFTFKSILVFPGNS